uniref:Rhophilin Rho GTPase binding protein 1 n=1 Tax=Loxodonta africana TaxID=9785 RepID=G3U7U6_LOXAF
SVAAGAAMILEERPDVPGGGEEERSRPWARTDIRRGCDPLAQSQHSRLQTRRARVHQLINKELRIRTGAENLYRATSNSRVRETVVLELSYVNASLQLLKEELEELNSGMDTPRHQEGVRIPMIPLGLKETKELDWSTPLKELISGHFGEDSASYEAELKELEDLRQAMRTPSRDQAGLELLTAYYSQLCFLDARFSTPARSLGLLFHWYDSLTGVPAQQRSLAFEKGSVLFNIGALYTQIGARQDRSCIEGTSRAIEAFQRAAGKGRSGPPAGVPSWVLAGAGTLDQGVGVPSQVLAGAGTDCSKASVVHSPTKAAAPGSLEPMRTRRGPDPEAGPGSWWKAEAPPWPAFNPPSPRAAPAAGRDTEAGHPAQPAPPGVPGTPASQSSGGTSQQMGHLCRTPGSFSGWGQAGLSVSSGPGSKAQAGLAVPHPGWELGSSEPPSTCPLSAKTHQKPEVRTPSFSQVKAADIFHRLGPLSVFSAKNRWRLMGPVRVTRGEGGFGFTLRGDSPVLIAAVIPGGRAAAAGLKAGDYIVSVNRQPCRWWKHAEVVAQLRSAGDEGVDLGVVTLLSRAEPPGT